MRAIGTREPAPTRAASTRPASTRPAPAEPAPAGAGRRTRWPWHAGRTSGRTRLRARLGVASTRGRVRVDAAALMPHLDDRALRRALVSAGAAPAPAQDGSTEHWRTWLRAEMQARPQVRRLVQAADGRSLSLTVHARDLALWACRERVDVLAAVVLAPARESVHVALAQMGTGSYAARAFTCYLVREGLSGRVVQGWHARLARDLAPHLHRLLVEAAAAGMVSAAQAAGLAPWVLDPRGQHPVAGARALAYRSADIDPGRAHAMEHGPDRPTEQDLQALVVLAALRRA